MSEDIIGLIFSIVWLSCIAIAWYFAMFKGYDKIWSDGIIKYQSKFTFFELARRFNKAWHSPLMIKVFVNIFLIAGFFMLSQAILGVIHD
jgi:hypothetical protein